jgi:hypothetical protein
MADEKPQQAQRASIFTNGVIIYDNNNASVTFGYVDKKATLTFSPVYDNMKGKDPQKGEKMYNYEARQMITFDYKQICILKAQIDLLESEEIDECSVESEKRIFSLAGSGIFEGIDNLSMSILNKESNKMIQFEFATTEVLLGIKYVNEKEKKKKDTICPDWDLFKEFINTAKLNYLGAIEHNVRLATNNAPFKKREEGGHEPPKRRFGSGTGKVGNGTTPKTRAGGSPEDYFDESFEGEEDGV